MFALGRAWRFNVDMRAFVVVCVFFLASSALADTFFIYKDPATKRDVFVNNLEQVPAVYRETARPVHTGAEKAEPMVEAIGKAGDGGPLQLKDLPVSLEDLKKTAVGAMAGGSPIKVASQTMVSVMDLKLKASGRPGLFPSEVISFSKLFVLVMVLFSVAGVVSFVAWVIFLFHAVRSRRFVWMIAIILVYPLAYPYALFCVEKGRWKLRYLGFLSLVSPALVGLFAFWRFFVWFHAVINARANLG